MKKTIGLLLPFVMSSAFALNHTITIDNSKSSIGWAYSIDAGPYCQSVERPKRGEISPNQSIGITVDYDKPADHCSIYVNLVSLPPFKRQDKFNYTFQTSEKPMSCWLCNFISQSKLYICTSFNGPPFDDHIEYYAEGYGDKIRFQDTPPSKK